MHKETLSEKAVAAKNEAVELGKKAAKAIEEVATEATDGIEDLY